MEPDFVIDWPLFDRTFNQFAALTGKSMEEELMNQGRLFSIDCIKVTPPFHQGVGQGITVAKRAGEKSIGRNMNHIFAPVNLVGSRKITHLFGKTDVAGLPFIVPTAEKFPDVAGMYRTKKIEARQRARMRFVGPPEAVDRRKVRRIYREEIKKVGFLAGGWNIAATKLGAGNKIPAFVRRHGSAPGSVAIDFRPERLRIVLENQVGYADRVGGMQKRASFALRKRVHAMQRQIPYLIRKASSALM